MPKPASATTHDPVTGMRLKRRGGKRSTQMAVAVKARDLLAVDSRCYLCNFELRGSTERSVEVDHIIPCKVDYDTLEFEYGNLVVACNVCNKAKGDRRLGHYAEKAHLEEVERRNKAQGIAAMSAGEILRRYS